MAPAHPSRILIVFAVGLGAIGCSSRRTPVPGAPCSVDTDCESPLKCTSGGPAGRSVCAEPIVPEIEPNDDREHAVPYVPGTQVTATSSAGDSDFFSVTAPADDPAGGYYQVAITDVSVGGTVNVKVFTAPEYGLIGSSDGAAAGESSFFFWAAAPGKTYWIQTYGGGGGSIKYTFAATYTKIDDPYEPNDDGDSAAPITLGQPIEAYYFSGFTTAASDSTSDEDWYSVELGEGTVTATLTDSGPRTVMEIFILNEDGQRRMLGMSDNTGGNVPANPLAVPKPGRYRLIVRSTTAGGGWQQGSGDLLKTFTQPYSLVVTQP